MEGGASRWRCERTLGGHVSGVWCIAAWGDRAACGCGDGGIRVWSTETWALERTLQGHNGCVRGMAVSGGRLMSSSIDRKVRVWSTETWGCVQTVEAYPAGSPQYIWRLAVSGSTLVGGSSSNPPSATEEYEVRVWDLETLQPLHTLRQQAGQKVQSLVHDRGEVWGAVGRQVVVWGRRG